MLTNGTAPLTTENRWREKAHARLDRDFRRRMSVQHSLGRFFPIRYFDLCRGIIRLSVSDCALHNHQAKGDSAVEALTPAVAPAAGTSTPKWSNRHVPELICEDKETLLDAWGVAAQHYARVVEDLKTAPRATDAFRDLLLAAESASAQVSEAREAVSQHVAVHGC